MASVINQILCITEVLKLKKIFQNITRLKTRYTSTIIQILVKKKETILHENIMMTNINLSNKMNTAFWNTLYHTKLSLQYHLHTLYTIHTLNTTSAYTQHNLCSLQLNTHCAHFTHFVHVSNTFQISSQLPYCCI